MHVFEIIVALKTQPRSQITLRILFLQRPTITEESKAILTFLISVLEVLPLRLPQDSRQMRGAAGPDTMDSSSRSSAIVPGAALPAHVGAGEECIAICNEVVCCTLGRRCGPYPLRGYLAQQFGDVRCLYLRSVRNGS